MCDNRFIVNLKVTKYFYASKEVEERIGDLIDSILDCEGVVDVERGETTYQRGLYVPATLEEIVQHEEG